MWSNMRKTSVRQAPSRGCYPPSAWAVTTALSRAGPEPARFPLECAPGAVRGRSDEQVTFKELLESWRERSAAPRTAEAYAARLPLDAAAQLAEMFPRRAPEQLITELLGVALNEVAAAMPYIAGKRVISNDEQGDPLYEDVGPTPRFMELARKHRRRLESRLAGREAAGGPAKQARPKPKRR